MLWLGIIIISLVGTLAHFLYDISGHNKVLGLFSAVNESTWEHIKIALTPTILWSLCDGAIYGQNPNYFLAKLASLLVLVIVIPTIFYSYRSFVKKPILIIDILNFYVSIILSQLAFYAIINLPAFNFVIEYFACLGTFVFFGAYTLLTLMPIKSFIFKDPISHKYGFQAHTETFNIFKKKKRK